MSGAGYIGQNINSEPSDQTNLKEWHRYNLGGGGGTDVEAKHGRWAQGVSQPMVGPAGAT